MNWGLFADLYLQRILFCMVQKKHRREDRACTAEKRTKRSSNTLLRLVRFSAVQTLAVTLHCCVDCRREKRPEHMTYGFTQSLPGCGHIFVHYNDLLFSHIISVMLTERQNFSLLNHGE